MVVAMPMPAIGIGVAVGVCHGCDCVSERDSTCFMPNYVHDVNQTKSKY